MIHNRAKIVYYCTKLFSRCEGNFHIIEEIYAIAGKSLSLRYSILAIARTDYKNFLKLRRCSLILKLGIPRILIDAYSNRYLKEPQTKILFLLILRKLSFKDRKNTFAQIKFEFSRYCVP